MELGVGQGDRVPPRETSARRGAHRLPVQQAPADTRGAVIQHLVALRGKSKSTSRHCHCHHLLRHPRAAPRARRGTHRLPRPGSSPAAASGGRLRRPPRGPRPPPRPRRGALPGPGERPRGRRRAGRAARGAAPAQPLPQRGRPGAAEPRGEGARPSARPPGPAAAPPPSAPRPGVLKRGGPGGTGRIRPPPALGAGAEPAGSAGGSPTLPPPERPRRETRAGETPASRNGVAALGSRPAPSGPGAELAHNQKTKWGGGEQGSPNSKPKETKKPRSWRQNPRRRPYLA